MVEVQKLQQLQMLASTLPRPEISVFSGSLVEHSDFVRTFENLIESRTNDLSSRLYYLIQYTSGEVKELMQSFLSMDFKEGYETARALLKDRYDQSYKMASALIDRVIKPPQMKADNGPALQRYSVLVTSCTNSLREIGYLNKIENPDTLQQIIRRLPLGLRLRWREGADVITESQEREITIGDKAEFVKTKARIVNHPVFGNIHANDGRIDVASTGSQKNQTTPKERKGSTFTAQVDTSNSQTDLPKGTSSPVPKKYDFKCLLCKTSPWMPCRELFIGKTLDERVKVVRSRGLCDNCLRPGYVAVFCPKKSYCQIAVFKIGHRKLSTFLQRWNRLHRLRPSQAMHEMKDKIMKRVAVSRR